jgi:hypothetical protein
MVSLCSVLLRSLNIDICDLFEIWCLIFGIFKTFSMAKSINLNQPQSVSAVGVDKKYQPSEKFTT